MLDVEGVWNHWNSSNVTIPHCLPLPQSGKVGVQKPPKPGLSWFLGRIEFSKFLLNQPTMEAKLIVVLLCVCYGVVSAQTPPNINNDYIAQVDMLETHGTHI